MKNHQFLGGFVMVERRGFEPLTSTMRTLRATKVSVLYPQSTHQRFKPANQEQLIKDYTILKAIRTAPCSEKRQMTIPDVSCIPIKEPIDCFQAKRFFSDGFFANLHIVSSFFRKRVLEIIQRQEEVDRYIVVAVHGDLADNT